MKYVKLILKILIGLYCAFAIILSIGWWQSDEPLLFLTAKTDYYDKCFKNYVDSTDTSSRGLKSTSIYNKTNYISFGYEGISGFCGSYSIKNHDILMRHMAVYDIIINEDKDSPVFLYVFNYSGDSKYVSSMPDEYFIPVSTEAVKAAGFVRGEQIRDFKLRDKEDRVNGTPATCDLRFNNKEVNDIYVSPMAAKLYSSSKGEDRSLIGKMLYIEWEDDNHQTYRGVFQSSGTMMEMSYLGRYN